MVSFCKEFDGAGGKELLAKAAAKWKTLSDDDKLQYEKMHEEDVERQVRQTEQLLKLGYFTMEDGSKSTDHKPKKKRVKRDHNDTARGDEESSPSPTRQKKP